MKVCGECGNLGDAYRMVNELKPDVILLDIKLPDGDGVSGCREIKKIAPKTKVTILTAYGEDSLIMEVIKAGADGYLLKNIDSKMIISSIREVSKGSSILDLKVLNKVMELIKNKENINTNLTQQEQNILALVIEVKTNKEISQKLYIAEKTVRNYVSKKFKKINASNRTEAAMYWMGQKSSI